MSLSESLLPYSIEGFLTDAEADRVVAVIDDYKSQHSDTLAAGARGVSVHVSDSLDIEELVAMYEPRGRIDINTNDIPPEVIDIMERAFFRRIEDVRRAYPTATWPYGITYVEYGPQQFFTPHADGMTDIQCAGFGVTLTDGFTGGEFCVETCGSHRLWVAGADGQPNLAPGANVGSEWFRDLPRTRWAMSPRKGVAVFYGSALVHASQPVIDGTLKKVLAFIARG